MVRSKLEYCSSVWCPSQKYLITKLERVQKRLIKWLCFRDRIPYESDDYIDMCHNYGLQTLENRRKITDLCNLNKVFNNNINCSYLVSNISLNVPDNRRRRRYPDRQAPQRPRLLSDNSRLNIRKDTFIPRVVSLVSEHDDLNIFESDKLVFKRHVLSMYQ